MTIARTFGINLFGLSGERIDIEVDISNGLPAYLLLGLPDATLNESRDRIRSAILNSGFQWPNKKVTVSLSPAWIPKSGSAFDLPIALAILAASDQFDSRFLADSLFLGELSLDGELRQIKGVLPMLLRARALGINRAYLPVPNRGEAVLVKDMDIQPFHSINELTRFFRSGERIEIPALTEITEVESQVDFAEVAGQEVARFALEIAAIGGHHALMIGPPGAGKTMLAERLPTILPPLTESEALESAGIKSIAGIRNGAVSISKMAPFVAPHHATTIPALIGGGSAIKPGACSLAHNGVLFIDEAPECATGLLDSLRQPLESGEIAISRSQGTARFPARFLLLLAANPCPCGRFAGRGRACSCSSVQVRRYLAKISGPLLDRIDIRIRVEQPTRSELSNEGSGESSSKIRERVIAARNLARDRFAGLGFHLNSQIPSKSLREIFRAERRGMATLHSLLDKEEISARGFHRILRTSWSIADRNQKERPGVEEIERALELRSGFHGND